MRCIPRMKLVLTGIMQKKPHAKVAKGAKNKVQQKIFV